LPSRGYRYCSFSATGTSFTKFLAKKKREKWPANNKKLRGNKKLAPRNLKLRGMANKIRAL
jgi:hypothetical protein